MKKVILVYAGQRIDGDSTLKCFMNGKKEVYYSKIKWVIIGHQYEAKKNGENLSLPRRPENLGLAEIDQELLDEWHTLDKIAEQFLRTKRAYNKSKQLEPEFEVHVAPLRRIYLKLKSHEERKAFINRIDRLISFGK